MIIKLTDKSRIRVSLAFAKGMIQSLKAPVAPSSQILPAMMAVHNSPGISSHTEWANGGKLVIARKNECRANVGVNLKDSACFVRIPSRNNLTMLDRVSREGGASYRLRGRRQ